MSAEIMYALALQGQRQAESRAVRYRLAREARDARRQGRRGPRGRNPGMRGLVMPRLRWAGERA